MEESEYEYETASGYSSAETDEEALAAIRSRSTQKTSPAAARHAVQPPIAAAAPVGGGGPREGRAGAGAGGGAAGEASFLLSAQQLLDVAVAELRETKVDPTIEVRLPRAVTVARAVQIALDALGQVGPKEWTETIDLSSISIAARDHADHGSRPAASFTARPRPPRSPPRSRLPKLDVARLAKSPRAAAPPSPRDSGRFGWTPRSPADARHGPAHGARHRQQAVPVRAEANAAPHSPKAPVMGRPQAGTSAKARAGALEPVSIPARSKPPLAPKSSGASTPRRRLVAADAVDESLTPRARFTLPPVDDTDHRFERRPSTREREKRTLDVTLEARRKAKAYSESLRKDPNRLHKPLPKLKLRKQTVEEKDATDKALEELVALQKELKAQLAAQQAANRKQKQAATTT